MKTICLFFFSIIILSACGSESASLDGVYIGTLQIKDPYDLDDQSQWLTDNNATISIISVGEDFDLSLVHNWGSHTTSGSSMSNEDFSNLSIAPILDDLTNPWNVPNGNGIYNGSDNTMSLNFQVTDHSTSLGTDASIFFEGSKQ